MEYRKKKDSDTWHWCTNCSNWPTSDYDSRDTKPTYGELDNECKAKDRAAVIHDRSSNFIQFKFTHYQLTKTAQETDNHMH